MDKKVVNIDYFTYRNEDQEKYKALNGKKKNLTNVHYVVYYVACLYINKNFFPYRIELI